MIFNIVNGTRIGRSKFISPADLVNFYPEIEDPQTAKHPRALIGCPGYRLAVQASATGSGRGIYSTSTDRMFTAVSNKIVEILPDETKTDRGTISTIIGSCKMCDNGVQLLIVDGTYGYILVLGTNVLTRITAAGFPTNPTSCIFTDGYFLVSAGGTGRFDFSASYDGMTWSALDFATAEYSADNLVGVAETSNGTIWMIGKQTVEQWNNVGTENLPWRRIGGSVKKIGCIAPDSIASNGTNVFWLGNGQNGYAAVYMGIGYEVVRISTPNIEYTIKGLTNISEAEAFVYTDETISFYVLSFSAEKTLVYDLSTGEWHKRASFNAATGMNYRQFARGCAFMNGKFYVGSYLNGNIYEMSLDILDEAGEKILREIVTPTIESENRRLQHKGIEIDCGKGIGLENGLDPMVMMRFSDDNGNTWSNEDSESAGKIGDFEKKVKFRRLGSSEARVYWFQFSDAVKWVINRLILTT